MAELKVCADGEIPEGEVRIVTSGDLQIGVFFRAGRYHAYLNVCPHQGGPVCEGLRMHGVIDRVEDGLYLGQSFDEDDLHIVCPWHGYEFHLETGENVCDRQIKLKRYAVERRGGDVYVVV